MPLFSDWIASMEPPRPASSFRNIFTTIFIVGNFLVIFLGGRLIKRRAQRRIVKNNRVIVTHMTPWFSLYSTCQYAWKFGKMPGGFIGFLMIISGVFDRVDTYFVNTYITDYYSQSTCKFDHGLVAYFGDSANSRNAIAPASLWPLSILAVRALSFADEEKRGVYSKVDLKFNKKGTIFSPTEEDLLGHWKCSNESIIKFPSSNLNNSDAIYSAIYGQNFLYNRAISSAGTNTGGNISEVMIWSANETESSTWEMKATMGVNVSDSLLATNYRCTYKSERNWNAPIIKLQPTLEDWRGLMVGYLVDSSIEFSASHIEIMLNAMSMVAASGNSLYYANNKALEELDWRDRSYGCTKIRAEVENQIWIVFFILVVVVGGLAVIDIYKLIRYKSSSRSKIADKMPFEMMDWQLVSIQHMTGKQDLKHEDLKDYEYFHDRSTGEIKAIRRQQVGILVTLLPTHPSLLLCENVRTIKKATLLNLLMK